MNGLQRLIGLAACLSLGVHADERPTVTDQATGTGTVTVTMDQLKSSKGGLMVHLYANDDGFPDTPDKASITLYIPPSGQTARALFPTLPYGTYAIAVCHDENGNNDCDSNFLGIPQEGVGVSNNASGFMGPPKFKDAEFELDSPQKELSIKLDY